MRINNEKKLTFYDVFGTPVERADRPGPHKSLPVPLSESPILRGRPGGIEGDGPPRPGLVNTGTGRERP